ncbi:MAG: hypothetical protein LR015_02500 [Verrucomicrobia bacterium]|nr:hypothetical protein [Verrucomicrobiota bacterium]
MGKIIAGLLTGILASGCVHESQKNTAPDPRYGYSVEPRPLAPEIWGRKAISYSGFRRDQSPQTETYPTTTEVLEDLRLLERAGFGLLRVYSGGYHGRMVIELIATHELNLKVKLGAYLSGSTAENGPANREELERVIALANEYPDIVVAVSVGNEVLVSWSFVPVPPAEMVGHIREVRSRVVQPVTVNDNWEPFAVGMESPIQKVWREIDFASVHTYAYWDAGFRLWPFEQAEVPAGQRSEAVIRAAVAYAQSNFEAVRAALDAAGLGIPIVIGESGWQSHPSAYLEEAFVQDFAQRLAGVEAMQRYYRAMMAWAYGEDYSAPGDGFSRPATMFYFSAFDEPWKQADDNWGIWDVDRQPKFNF